MEFGIKYTKVVYNTTLLFFVFILVAFGLSKIIYSSDFIFLLNSSGLNSTLSILVAIFIPPLEVLLGLALIVKRIRYKILLYVLYLFFIFTGYLIYIWIFTDLTACGCFVGLEDWISLGIFPSIIRNGLLISATLYLMKKSEAFYEKSIPKFAVAITIASIFLFQAGMFFSISPINHTSEISNGKKVEKSLLKSLYSFDKNLDYIVYFFSETCPYCETISNYLFAENHISVDRIIGFTSSDTEKYHLNSESIYIERIDKNVLRLLTNQVPYAVYVSDGVIYSFDLQGIHSRTEFVERLNEVKEEK